MTRGQPMIVSITDRMIQRITLAALIVAVLCIPGRADPIGDRLGACCLTDGSCVVVTEDQCQAQGGTYQGDDVTCDDADCPPLGACCIPFDICMVTTIQECFGELGGAIWAPGQDCETFTCPPLGACCNPDGTCQITSQSTCENSHDGVYQGDGVECQDSTCAQSCPADFDGDGSVGATDLLLLLGSWGPCKGCPADFDENGNVGASDLLTLLVNWGPCP